MLRQTTPDDLSRALDRLAVAGIRNAIGLRQGLHGLGWRRREQSLRFVHTSDWHLGRSLGEYSLLDHQAAFIDWLVELVKERKVDLVIVAGDLFDRSLAPYDALRLFRTAISELRGAGAMVAAITGNHDGADRVANYGPLLDASGVHIRGGYDAIGEVLRLDFDDGPLDLVLVPYLHPEAAPDVLGPLEEQPKDEEEAMARRRGRTHEGVLAAAIDAALPHIGTRTIAVSHSFVAGGDLSGDSERQLSIGGADQVPGELFRPFSYTALGHLHRPQLVDGLEHIRYSGTPLAYSFSEAHEKSVLVVDMAPDGSCDSEMVPIPVGRAVKTFEGTMEELLSGGVSSDDAEKFIRAIVTDASAVLDAKPRLRKVFPYLVDVDMRALYRPPSPGGGTSGRPRSARRPSELAAEFWEVATDRPPTDEERELLDRALAEGQKLLDAQRA